LTLRDTFRKKLEAALSHARPFLPALFSQRRLFPLRNRQGWRRAQSQNGQALVEFALTSSILMGFVFSVMETCLIFYTYGMISESAREGTRYAIVHGATCVTSSGVSCTASPAAIKAYVLGLGWPNLGGGNMDVATSFPDVTDTQGSRVQVTVKYTFPIDLPLVHPGSLSLSSSSEMYIVQ
jgi:Flp pilus assembly protein TadG